RLDFCTRGGSEMSIPTTVASARPVPGDSAVLKFPGLERRSELLDRRPLALRRHTTRVATRFAVLLAGDIVAILLTRAIAYWLYLETDRGAEAFGASPLLPDARHGIFLAVITLVAIFAAGGHSRHRALNKPIRLFGAVAGACLINWAPIISRGGLSSVLLTIVSTAGLLWFCVLVVRELSEWFLNHVWPRQRGAAGAIL